MQKRVKIILGVSIALNILLLSMVGGMGYKRYSSHPWHKTKMELSPETRHVVGRTLQSAFREIKPLGDDARKARAQLIKVLSAEEFDGDAFDKAVEKMNAVKTKMKAHKIAATKEIASQLPVEERVKMADRMAKMIGGGREHRVKRHRNPMRIKPDRKPDPDR